MGGVSQNWRLPFLGDLYNKDYNILEPMFGAPYSGKLPHGLPDSEHLGTEREMLHRLINLQETNGHLYMCLPGPQSR